MVRKLEKIEKEMGYCEIKLEKEQRLRTQLHFLKLHLKGLEDAVERFSARESELCDGNRLAGRRLPDVLHLASVERDPQGTEELREAFRCVGALPLLRDEREMMRRETDELESKLQTFKAFSEKKKGLLVERQQALHSFEQDESTGMLETAARFEEIEKNWNTLTEDLMNVDESIFYVSRTVDYLQSARDFILASRSQFGIDKWIQDGYLIDLFKHSTVGRAKEMVEGADRNLKMALVELVCLEELLINPEDFEHLLLPFLDALFDDLFVHSKLNETLELLETRVERARQLHEKLQEEREAIFSRQLEEEENRGKLFTQMGDERKRLSLA